MNGHHYINELSGKQGCLLQITMGQKQLRRIKPASWSSNWKYRQCWSRHGEWKTRERIFFITIISWKS